MTAAGAAAHERQGRGWRREGAGPAWLPFAGILLAAAVLRVLPWLANYPLHRDEALYGYWAQLIASGRDPLLLTPWIDKPPLSIYLAASSLALWDVSELALRAPGMIASLLTVGATYALARQIYGTAAARLAAGLFAVSPFAILFAPTAFTDPWLTLWLTAAAWAALARRGFLAGAAVGLAVASKQQGVLGAPLILALLLLTPAAAPARRANATALPRTQKQPRPREPFAAGSTAWAKLARLSAAVIGAAAIIGPLTYWDSLRWHNRPSFWDRSLTTYNPLLVAPLAEWPARAADWAQQLGYFFGTPALSWSMLAAAGVTGLLSIHRLASGPRDARTEWAGLWLAAYAAGFLALHVIVTFQPWDRYLLPLLPLSCILAARGLIYAFRRGRRPLAAAARRAYMAAAALSLVAALGYGAWLGATGRIPVGSDRSAYAGIREVADTLRRQPGAAIIYHQSLGWYFDFYLFDAPQERRWYDTGEKLAREAARTAEQEPGRPQWLVITAWETGALEAAQPALSAAGLALSAAAEAQRADGSPSFALYHIVPLAARGGT